MSSIRKKNMEPYNLQSLVEALLFVSEKPLTAAEISRLYESSPKEISEAVEALGKEYQAQNRGLRIIAVAGGYQMCTAPEFAELIRTFHSQRFSQRLSNAALEVLAIIAYKQPVTKMEIEALRGVNIDKMMKNLLKARLIKMSGRKEIPGRPFLYGTTREFLEFFGLRSLKDLPKSDDELLGKNQPSSPEVSPAEAPSHNENEEEEDESQSETVAG